MNNVFKTEINDELVLYQKEGGLTFGTDAYLLYAYMRSKVNAIAADFGSGTGIISLLCSKKKKFGKIFACELQHDFCDIIKLNIKENALDKKIELKECNVCNLTVKDFERELDVVFTNPPYMKNSNGKRNVRDIKNIARHEIYGTLEDFILSASRILKYGGYFYAVYRPERLGELISVSIKHSLEPKKLTFVHNTAASKPSLVLFEAKKGARQSLFVTPPLILKNSDGSQSDDIKFIYDNGEFDEKFKKS